MYLNDHENEVLFEETNREPNEDDLEMVCDGDLVISRNDDLAQMDEQGEWKQ